MHFKKIFETPKYRTIKLMKGKKEHLGGNPFGAVPLYVLEMADDDNVLVYSTNRLEKVISGRLDSMNIPVNLAIDPILLGRSESLFQAAIEILEDAVMKYNNKFKISS